MWDQGVGTRTLQRWAELGPSEHMNSPSHTVTKSTTDQKDTSNPTIWPFEGIPHNGQRITGKFHSKSTQTLPRAPASERTRWLPRELFKFHKNLHGATAGSSEFCFRHFSFPLHFSICLSTKTRVPTEDLVFQLNSILLLVGRRPLGNPMGVVLQLLGLWDPHTLTPHHCCTEIPTQPEVLPQGPQNLPKLLLFKCWLKGQRDPEIRIVTREFLSSPTFWISLHWDWLQETTPVFTKETHKSAQQINYY